MITGGVINSAWTEGIINKTITIQPSEWFVSDGLIIFTVKDKDIKDNSFIPVIFSDSSRDIASTAGLGKFNPVFEIGRMILKGESIPEGAITFTYSIIL